MCCRSPSRAALAIATTIAAGAVGCGRAHFDALGDGSVASDSDSGSDAAARGDGFFVEVHVASMNFGDIAGANGICFNRLDAGTFLGKDEVEARGSFDLAHIRAWLCDSNGCQDLARNRRYRYATLARPTSGGGTFTSTEEGYLEDDGVAFEDPTRFDIAAEIHEYATGREQDNTVQVNGTCGDWADTTMMTGVGLSDVEFYPEKLRKYPKPCGLDGYLICAVDPI